MILALLLACSDPVLDPLGEALQRYEQGRAALDSGRTVVAASHFHAAAALDPQNPLLPSWEAHARWESGDLEGAAEVLRLAMERFPLDPDLRQRRAGLLCKVGRYEEAADELRRILESGLRRPSDFTQDPDLAALGSLPEYAELVPPPPLALQVAGEAGAVLRGEPWVLRVAIQLGRGAQPELRLLQEAPDFLQLVRVVQDLRRGDPDLMLVEYHYLAVGPGKGSIGPFELRAGNRSAGGAALPVEVVAVGQAAPARAAWQLGLPLLPVEPEPKLPVQGERWSAVLGAPGSGLSLSPERPAVALDIRRESQPYAVGLALPRASGASARVSRGDELLWSGPLP